MPFAEALPVKNQLAERKVQEERQKSQEKQAPTPHQSCTLLEYNQQGDAAGEEHSIVNQGGDEPVAEAGHIELEGDVLSR